MEFEIKPVTEMEIKKIILKSWSIMNDEQKNYSRQLYFNICIQNNAWRLELEKIFELNNKNNESFENKKTIQQKENEFEEEPEEVDISKLENKNNRM